MCQLQGRMVQKYIARLKRRLWWGNDIEMRTRRDDRGRCGYTET